MSQGITATFVDGVLKPEEKLALASGTKVRLTLEIWESRLEGQPLSQGDVAVEIIYHIDRDGTMSEMGRTAELFKPNVET